MGCQIAHQVARGGYPVTLYGRSAERVAAGVQEAAAVLARWVKKGRLSADDYDATVSRVRPTTDLEEAAGDADLIIKTVSEDRAVKREVLCALGRIAPESAIIGSNSSTMPSSFFVDCVPNPSRLLNLHFFNPALVMQLVEVVRGPHTDPAVADTCVEFARRIGRTPVLVRREAYGFVANRILFIAMQEAFRLVEQGVVSMKDCDLAVTGGLNWPMGPFALADLVGLDVTADILEQGRLQTGEERWAPTAILTDRVDAGELGRKTGKGFFDYSGA